MSQLEEIAVAGILRDAYRGGAVEPLASRLPPGDLQAAYRVQEYNTRLWIEARGGIAGRKIGLSSPAQQQRFGVEQPTFGVLFADMEVPSGERIGSGRLLQPRIEAEIAVHMSRDVTDPQVTEEQLLDVVDWVAPALEIVDSRIRDWRISVTDMVADNGASGLFVIGERRLPPRSIDVIHCSMRLFGNRELLAQGSAAASQSNPIRAVAWLARKSIETGRPLGAGEVILSGALGAMIPMKQAVEYEAAIEGLGSVSVSY